MKNKITYLDRNEYNYGPAPEVVEALKKFDPETLCFYTRIYDEGKKSIFSEYLSETYNIPERQIILGYGGEDILKQVVHYYLAGKEKEKKILIPKFSWWYYKSIADEVEGKSILYPLYEDGNTFRYDFDALKKALEEEKPEMLLIASPNNPTGNFLTADELEKILSFVDFQTIVVIDEAYASFTNKDTSYIKPLLEKHPNVLIVRTLSKFYGLPGLRLGFAFMGTALEKFLSYSTKYLGYNRISEELGIAALKATDYYEKVATQMAEDREMYIQELRPINGFKVYDSNANFILVKYPIELKERLQAALKAEGLLIKFMNEPDINTHMRITLGTHQQNRMVVDIIKEVALK
ncbi:histidinol-phosphate aminotransferase family protein [Porphyromonadaceae bacterium OttesenSCG-928-L07]|nr:histidinol-phosphate aminotransferase family protein [Porphyromonadaceae bacterium OttesenSCG-928-L07]MDL2251270.1 histidinol-phosphate aminotransferase family protein [Odoribacter sp. OttesenSCG-928-J03]